MTATSTAATAAPVTIRRATPADTAAVAEMVREIAAHEERSAHVHVDEAQWRALLTRPEVIVLLAERDGSPVPRSEPEPGEIAGPTSAAAANDRP